MAADLKNVFFSVFLILVFLFPNIDWLDCGPDVVK